MTDSTIQYGGFWRRALALLIDLAVLVGLGIAVGISGSVFHTDKTVLNLLAFALSVGYLVLMPVVRGATLGKQAVGLHIVDADSGEHLSLPQSALRWVGTFISSAIFLLGYFWVAFDARKQGWHDKICNSVVVKAD